MGADRPQCKLDHFFVWFVWAWAAAQGAGGVRMIPLMTAGHHDALRRRMADLFEYKTYKRGPEYFNLYPWWRDAEVLSGVGGLLAEPFRDAKPTVVIGPESSGYLAGARAAAHLGVGFCPIRKDPSQSFDSDAWITVTSPPDYRDRHVGFGLRKGLVQAGDRVLAVDDLAETGGQLFALQSLVEGLGATWLGASVLVDNLRENLPRRQLKLASVFHRREL
jgi:adenine phosphoribosyltransferase